MKEFAVMALYFATLFLSLGVVGFLIYHDAKGWGWLLLAILFIYGSISLKVD